MKTDTTRRVSEFLVGLLFGCGLLISGMTDPGKVLAFLDLAGLWDPSLALVMGGAILVGLVAFRIARRREHNAFGEPLKLPTARNIDAPLVIGALLFGVGWGLAGLCPGPAVVSVATGEGKAMLFVLALLVGMGLHELSQYASSEKRKPA